MTLEPGVNWLNFNLYGDHSEGFDLDQVAASSGTLQRVRSEFILRDITEDVTVTFTTTGMIVTVTFVSKQVATVTPEKGARCPGARPLSPPRRSAAAIRSSAGRRRTAHRLTSPSPFVRT